MWGRIKSFIDRDVSFIGVLGSCVLLGFVLAGCFAENYLGGKNIIYLSDKTISVTEWITVLASLIGGSAAAFALVSWRNQNKHNHRADIVIKSLNSLWHFENEVKGLLEEGLDPNNEAYESDIYYPLIRDLKSSFTTLRSLYPEACSDVQIEIEEVGQLYFKAMYKVKSLRCSVKKNPSKIHSVLEVFHSSEEYILLDECIQRNRHALAKMYHS